MNLCCAYDPYSLDDGGQKKSLIFWVRLLFSVLAAGNSMVLAISINVSESSHSERLIIHSVLLIATLIVAMLVGSPLAYGIANAWKQRTLGVEALFVTGILGAFAYSCINMIRSEGAVYFEVISVLLIIYFLGNHIKANVQQRVLLALKQFGQTNQTCLRLNEQGDLITTPISEIQKGGRVRVFPGYRIPVDGVVEQGNAYVQESHITGEFYLQAKGEHHNVFAESHCVDGVLTIKATQDGSNRQVDRIVDSILQSQHKSKTELAADRIASYFFPIVLLAAALTAGYWGTIEGIGQGLISAMAVLLIACPCAFGFATPVGIWTAITRLSLLGLESRNAEKIESLSEIDCVIFDKTGTITQMNPAIENLIPVQNNKWQPEQLLTLASLAEQYSHHPLASCFHPNAIQTDESLRSQYEAADQRILPGKGIETTLTHRDHGEMIGLRIGDPYKLLSAAEQDTWKAIESSFQSSKNHALALWVNRELVCGIELKENLDQSFLAAVRQLQEMQIEVCVVSGDRQERLPQISNATTQGNVTPEQKKQFVVQKQMQGRKILFVGDGINDAAAMAEADVSIVVQGGAELTNSIADFRWNQNDFSAIPQMLKIANQTLSRLKSNLRMAWGYTALGMAAAALGWLHPVTAVLIMFGSSVLVTFRAASLLEDSTLIQVTS